MTPLTAGTRPRVGLVFPSRHPLSPLHWSGTPAGLAQGLEACGTRIVPIGVTGPPGLLRATAAVGRLGGRAGPAADRSPLSCRVRTAAVARALGRAGPLDAVLALGLDSFDVAAVLRTGHRVATYTDATLQQMWEHPSSDLRSLGVDEEEVGRWIARQRDGFGRCAHCYAATGWAASSITADYGVPGSRVSVVGIGHRPRTPDPRRHWDPPRFLFVGVDWHRKNGPAVLEAFDAVRDIHPEATLTVVGRHPELTGPGVRGMGELRRDRPGDQVVLDRLYAEATAFVLPSRFEPAGIVYLEAASAGLPVVLTSEGGARQVLGAGSIAVAPDDRPQLIQSLLRLCDPAAAESGGRAAAEAAARSRWADVAERMLATLLGRS